MPCPSGWACRWSGQVGFPLCLLRRRQRFRGAGLAASGAVVVNERGFDRLTPPSRRDRVTLGLVRLKEDADPKTIAAYLNARFSDVEAVPRVDVIKAETKHWTEGTNYGLIFRTGVVIALLVGTTIVYQVLASDIASLLPWLSLPPCCRMRIQDPGFQLAYR